MKTILNFLDPGTIQAIQQEIEVFKKQEAWAISTNYWSRELTEGIIGHVSVRFVGSELHTILLNKVQPFLPVNLGNIGIMHYLWHPLSGINVHNDSNFIFGATIYLNEEWNINWGGLLVSQDNTGTLHTHYPHFNSLVINDQREVHTVTTVSPSAPYLRHTIQIFAYPLH